MTRERLIEIYEAELRRAFYDLGDDFDLCREDINLPLQSFGEPVGERSRCKHSGNDKPADRSETKNDVA